MMAWLYLGFEEHGFPCMKPASNRICPSLMYPCSFPALVVDIKDSFPDSNCNTIIVDNFYTCAGSRNAQKNGRKLK